VEDEFARTIALSQRNASGNGRVAAERHLRLRAEIANVTSNSGSRAQRRASSTFTSIVPNDRPVARHRTHQEAGPTHAVTTDPLLAESQVYGPRVGNPPVVFALTAHPIT
jgi:hypothetical protein